MKKDLKKELKGQVMAIGSMMNKPRIRLDSKMLPEIKEWKIGEKYDIMLRVRQESMRELDEGKGMEASFEVLSAEVEQED